MLICLVWLWSDNFSFIFLYFILLYLKKLWWNEYTPNQGKANKWTVTYQRGEEGHWVNVHSRTDLMPRNIWSTNSELHSFVSVFLIGYNLMGVLLICLFCFLLNCLEWCNLFSNFCVFHGFSGYLDCFLRKNFKVVWVNRSRKSGKTWERERTW